MQRLSFRQLCCIAFLAYGAQESFGFRVQNRSTAAPPDSVLTHYAPPPDVSACRPFLRGDPDVFSRRERYADWVVDGFRLFRSSGIGGYYLNAHHFAVLHASSKADDPSQAEFANFVFEVPLLKGCFGGQNAGHIHSHTEGYLSNSVKEWNGLESRMVRVLRYDDLGSPPSLNADGFQIDNGGYSQVPHAQGMLESVSQLSACVKDGACQPLRISEVIALGHEVLRGQEWNSELLGAASMMPWKSFEPLAHAMQRLVEAWVAGEVPDTPASEGNAFFQNKINCRSFAMMLFYAVDALAKHKLQQGYGTAYVDLVPADSKDDDWGNTMQKLLKGAGRLYAAKG